MGSLQQYHRLDHPAQKYHPNVDANRILVPYRLHEYDQRDYQPEGRLDALEDKVGKGAESAAGEEDDFDDAEDEANGAEYHI